MREKSRRKEQFELYNLKLITQKGGDYLFDIILFTLCQVLKKNKI